LLTTSLQDAWEPCIVEHTAGALPETLLTFSAQEFLDVFTMDLWNGLSGDEQEALRVRSSFLKKKTKPWLFSLLAIEISA
jgi:hypothetical protein